MNDNKCNLDLQESDGGFFMCTANEYIEHLLCQSVAYARPTPEWKWCIGTCVGKKL